MLPRVRTILFPTDIGPQAINVLRHAEALAIANSAEIFLLHVVEPLSAHALNVMKHYLSVEAAHAIHESGIGELRQELESRLQSFLDEESAARSNSGLAMPSIRIAEGRPAETILREAEALHADVIVMGTHGHSALGEIVMGSVANRVLHRAEVPVFLIPFRSLVVT